MLWTITGAVAFFSQLADGGSQSLWFPALDGLGCLMTFGLSFKYGFGSLKKRDTVGFLVAIIGLALWYVTNNPLYALTIIIIIDAAGSGLTAWKAFENPMSETYPAWLIIGAAGFLAVLSVGKFDVGLLVYPVYIFIVSFIIVGSIYLGRRRSSN